MIDSIPAPSVLTAVWLNSRGTTYSKSSTASNSIDWSARKRAFGGRHGTPFRNKIVNWEQSVRIRSNLDVGIGGAGREAQELVLTCFHHFVTATHVVTECRPSCFIHQLVGKDFGASNLLNCKKKEKL
jgi:hypothetical protein